jgi:hypothetical protein
MAVGKEPRKAMKLDLPTRQRAQEWGLPSRRCALATLLPPESPVG